ncbi:MAG: type II secretion system protein, partial [Bacilli bacterium]
MNEKGFTLIELLVVMAIMGLITILIIPSVNQVIIKNRAKEYEVYEKLVIEKSKLYIDQHKEDYTLGTCFNINYNVLNMKSDGITCNGTIDINYLNNGVFLYKPLLECTNKSGKVIATI